MYVNQSSMEFEELTASEFSSGKVTKMNKSAVDRARGEGHSLLELVRMKKAAASLEGKLLSVLCSLPIPVPLSRRAPNRIRAPYCPIAAGTLPAGKAGVCTNQLTVML